jgi:hypothetical protein
MNGNGHEEGKEKRKSRLDRIEAAIELMIGDHEQLRQDYKQVLTAQVLLTDAQEKLTDAQGKLTDAQRKSEEKIAALAERMDRFATQQAERDRSLDARMDKLVNAVGELIRRMPLPPEA